MPCYDGPSVIFTEEDANDVHFPHNDALIIEIMTGNYTVYRVIIDNKGSVNILYTDCLEKMG